MSSKRLKSASESKEWLESALGIFLGLDRARDFGKGLRGSGVVKSVYALTT